MNKKVVIGSVVLVAVIVIGVCIWQGLQVKNKDNDREVQMASQNSKNPSGAGQGNRTRRNFAMTSGTVASVGDKSITIKPENGGSAIVFYSDKTSIVKVAKLVAADLVVGQSVVAGGTKEVDGTVTASTLKVRQSGETLSGVSQGGVPDSGQSVGGNSGAQNIDSTNPAVRTGDSNRGFVDGQITAIDGSKITVKLSDGIEKTVILADNTKITKNDTAAIEDAAEGTTVSVRGTKGSDGSIVAQMITIGEAETFGGGGRVLEGNMPQGGQPSVDQQSGQAPAQLPQIK